MNQHPIQNQVRIIGGQWRGRKIHFPSISSLRPTHDRIRETLFNWLMPYIQGSRCLDLFAGSGAMGFEALSRGAQSVVLIEQDPAAIAALRRNRTALGAEHATIMQASVLQDDIIFPMHSLPFDIVFLDPPFHQNLVTPSCAWLQKNNYIQPGSLIYIETERDTVPPAEYQTLQSKHTATIGYALMRVS